MSTSVTLSTSNRDIKCINGKTTLVNGLTTTANTGYDVRKNRIIITDNLLNNIQVTGQFIIAGVTSPLECKVFVYTSSGPINTSTFTINDNSTRSLNVNINNALQVDDYIDCRIVVTDLSAPDVDKSWLVTFSTFSLVVTKGSP